MVNAAIDLGLNSLLPKFPSLALPFLLLNFIFMVEREALVGSADLQWDIRKQFLVVTVEDHVKADQAIDDVLSSWVIPGGAQILKEFLIRLGNAKVLALVQQVDIKSLLVEAR